MNRRRFVSAASFVALTPLRAHAQIATPPIPGQLSLGLGLTGQDFKSLHGQPLPADPKATSNDYRGDGFTIRVYFPADLAQIHWLEVLFHPSVAPEAASRVTVALMPFDAVKLSEQIIDLSTFSILWSSDWLAHSQKPNAPGDDLWPNAQPGQFFTELFMDARNVASVGMALGNNP